MGIGCKGRQSRLGEGLSVVSKGRGCRESQALCAWLPGSGLAQRRDCESRMLRILDEIAFARHPWVRRVRGASRHRRLTRVEAG